MNIYFVEKRIFLTKDLKFVDYFDENNNFTFLSEDTKHFVLKNNDDKYIYLNSENKVKLSSKIEKAIIFKIKNNCLQTEEGNLNEENGVLIFSQKKEKINFVGNEINEKNKTGINRQILKKELRRLVQQKKDEINLLLRNLYANYTVENDQKIIDLEEENIICSYILYKLMFIENNTRYLFDTYEEFKDKIIDYLEGNYSFTSKFEEMPNLAANSNSRKLFESSSLKNKAMFKIYLKYRDNYIESEVSEFLIQEDKL